MASNGDIWQVTYYGTFFGQVWNMVQFYRLSDAVGGTTNPSDFGEIISSLLEGTNDIFTATIDGSISNQFVFDGAKAFNLFTLDEMTDETLSTPNTGGSAGESDGTFLAYRLFVGSKRRGMRSGSKFLPGVTESAVTNGGVVGSGMYSALQDFGNSFGSPQTVTFGVLESVVLTPIILKRIYVDGTAKPRQYRLPVDAGEATYYDVGAYLVDTHITTMNSRKIGHGV